MKCAQLITFFMICSLSIDAQRLYNFEADFVERALPTSEDGYFNRLNNRGVDLSVKIGLGKLIIEKSAYNRECKFELAAGVLIGINHGEWGGKLLYISNAHPMDTIEIKRGNIRQIFSLNGKIYVAEGLGHMSLREGFLYELDTTSGGFRPHLVVNFNDNLSVCAVYKSKILVVCGKGVYVVENSNSRVEVANLAWGGLYPNSIAALDDENIFIGMRGGIAKVNLKTHVLQFYQAKELGPNE